jgi:hypothetical protein
MWSWFRSGNEKVRIDGLEIRVSALEARISSASEILEATERMDRIIKRSFRLNKHLDVLEEKAKVEAGTENVPALQRSSLVRKLYG